MKIKYLSILIIVFLAACRKDGLQVEDNGNKNLNEISVSPQFDWKTTRDVNFSISVSDDRFQNNSHVIAIYVGDPSKDGQLISKGAANLITPFNTKISLPVALQEVYVEKIDPTGERISGLVKVSAGKVSVAVGEAGIIGSVLRNNNTAAVKSGLSVLANPTSEVSPACPQSPNVTISAGGDYDFVNGQVYAITGNNYTVKAKQDIKAKIYICGTNITLKDFKLSDNAEIYVLNGASVNFYNDIEWKGNNATFKNFGTITGLKKLKVTNGGLFYNTQSLDLEDFEIYDKTSKVINFGSELKVKNNATNKGSFFNYGSFRVKGTYTAYSATDSYTKNTSNFIVEGGGTSTFKGKFVNDATLNLIEATELKFDSGVDTLINNGILTAEKAKIHNDGMINNNGTFTVKNIENHYDKSAGNNGTIINNCHLIVTEEFSNNGGIVHNYALIEVKVKSKLDDKSTLNLYNHAMFYTARMETADGIIAGYGSVSLVKADISDTKVATNGGVKFKGAFQYCTNITIPSARFDGVAKQGCDVYIAKTSCNTVGNGTAPIVIKPDTDGDGIIDEEDDYPNDPTKAFKNYSLNYSTGGSSVAFEDSWPLKGDYDLNDIVITYRYMIVTNAQNKVVQVNADYKLLATGGKFNNGAGIQFNLPAASAKNFTGKAGTYLESGQDSVVVILFEDSRKEQQTWNTNPGETVSPVVDYSITFDVVNGPLLSAFGVSAYNPFIWNNTTGYGRGYETHLLGKKATNKVNSNLFGTGDDNSKSGRTYSTHDNLPWALEIPTAPFKYPKERVAITDAYLKFAQWATSSGTEYPNWYTNSASGYINNSLLY
ncbi:hypothetical protein Pedsa_1371 [Pseudopedobacter saltans DSM 12145]|uniref:DUF4842 domain-containing protein n=1 Tax=Pseudopedobacter saltans (strain ATCC 51119 / DSM 12145 / JCM 21818 / CCUG 39354 / LMG 10337 / NBRC 100064 / NCIMB 13643) TaxID=762903 RepID=F0SEP7_PSESL|nr:LruC domain-containing protein [Pseudopedobacter saltans]ADY51937.1 hypothetical protein Pedsa_1371 [Pseudopedobacter saltans DSM 12145]